MISARSVVSPARLANRTQLRIFLSTGEAVHLTTSTRRNWISKGNLSSSQTAAAGILKGRIGGGGIYCSSYGAGTTIYSYSVFDQKILVVTPVSN